MNRKIDQCNKAESTEAGPHTQDVWEVLQGFTFKYTILELLVGTLKTDKLYSELLTCYVHIQRPVQARHRQNPSRERWGRHKVLSLAEELVVTERCWERENQFSLGLWPW